MVVNTATGVVVQRMDYDGYGRLTNDTNPGFQCFGYAGGLWDEATGLVRFGARDYEPGVGRWTSRDPVKFISGAPNLFSYTSNDPVNAIDPYGLFRHYGNWGGARWTNGQDTWGESEHFPHLPGHPGYVPPVNQRDELYRQHDVDLMGCARIADPELRMQCRREADVDLGLKLVRFRQDHPSSNQCSVWQ